MPDAAELMKLLKANALEALDASKPVNILFGKVTSTEPLQIDVEQKMKLGKSQLFLSRNVTDFETEVTVDVETEKALGNHVHDLMLSVEAGGEPLHTHEATGSIQGAELIHTHKLKGRMKISVHNGLAVGDEVILLRSQGGQKYLVLDRIG